MRVKKHNKIIFIIIVIALIIISYLVIHKINLNKQLKLQEAARLKAIEDNYNEYVITNKECDIYDENFTKIGTISQNYELSLNGIIDEYYIIDNLDSKYYIKYTDVNKIEAMTPNNSTRFKKYIPYNQNINTKNITKLYNDTDNIVISLNKEYSFPIIIKETDKYGIVYNDKLLYIKKDNGEITNKKNTEEANTKAIPVLNYHFVYPDNDKGCKEIICHKESLVRTHLDYIKKNNYFTPTMKELEMYIDSKIQLPKSIVITYDDGRYLENVNKLMTEYELNGTFFVISGWRWNINFAEYHSDYLELHSHTHKMHDVGDCKTGQGGAIQCWSEAKIQEDLKNSRETLFNTTYFAYPFYEYNNYSIEQLKKAGFTMAFGGPYENGYKYVKPGIDKFKLPRLVIYNNTNVSTIESYLKLK